MASNSRHTENLRHNLANRAAIKKSRAVIKSGRLRYNKPSTLRTIGRPKGGR